MDASPKGSVSGWLVELKAGREAAAQQLWNRYFAQLVHLARGRLHGLHRDADEEDVALSALKSALIGVQNNRFPELHDRTGLWPLLVTITARKALNETKRQHAQKRGGGMERAAVDVDGVAGSEPPPEFAPQLVEAIQTLVSSLGDKSLQLIALRKLEGFTNEEIASELRVTTRTVARKLMRIRQEWDEPSEPN